MLSTRTQPKHDVNTQPSKAETRHQQCNSSGKQNREQNDLSEQQPLVRRLAVRIHSMPRSLTTWLKATAEAITQILPKLAR